MVAFFLRGETAVVGSRAVGVGVAGRSLNGMLCVLKQGQFQIPAGLGLGLGPEPASGGPILFGEGAGSSWECWQHPPR